MECHIGQTVIRYVEYGTGTPVIALHGAGVDHHDVEAAVEAIVPTDGSLLTLGYSYGAYIARGVTTRRADSVEGLALIWPFAEHTTEVPEPTVVGQDDDATHELVRWLHRRFAPR